MSEQNRFPQLRPTTTDLSRRAVLNILDHAQSRIAPKWIGNTIHHTLLLFLLVVLPALAQTPFITAVVNAANLTENIANGSIVTVFGSGLSGSTVRLCPFQQANTCSVVQLLFSSDTQINAVLPFQAALYGSNTEYLTITSGTATTPYRPLKLYEQAIGIFYEGWDCAFPATCAFAPAMSASQPILRGSVTDTSGRIITSLNPINSHDTYSVYFTGGGFAPDSLTRGAAVYSYLIPIGKQSGTIAFPSYSGHSPCCSGLDQINFSVPGDVLRGFSSDGMSVPPCSTFQFPLKIEMQLVIRGTANDSPYDAVNIPILINKGDVSCGS